MNNKKPVIYNKHHNMLHLLPSVQLVYSLSVISHWFDKSYGPFLIALKLSYFIFIKKKLHCLQGRKGIE